MCFIGHGTFGVITKAEWVPYFGVVGISRDAALSLMPYVGVVDITVGLLVLLRPMRAALAYMTVWALWTAALRPLSGDSVFELVERAGNYGVPLAFLLFLGPARSVREWFAPVNSSELTLERNSRMWTVLSVATALLLVGHGALAMQHKGILMRHAGLLGLSGEGAAIAGAIEIAAAAVVLLVPRPAVLLAVALWKVATELLYPIGGAPVWEFVERGGSYATPLALAILSQGRETARRLRMTPRVVGVGPLAAVAVLMSAVVPATVHGQDNVPVNPPGIVGLLRQGGYVLACRHAETDGEQSDRGSTRALQRNLTAEGEKQARSIGAAIRALHIPIGEVRANPMYRNQETATYAFGSMVVDSSLGGRRAGEALRSLLMTPVPRGTNRAIVARIGILSTAMQDHGVEVIYEGDCFVVQPIGGRDFRVLGRLGVQDWGRLSSR